jgi:hypothetical protein
MALALPDGHTLHTDFKNEMKAQQKQEKTVSGAIEQTPLAT